MAVIRLFYLHVMVQFCNDACWHMGNICTFLTSEYDSSAPLQMIIELKGFFFSSFFSLKNISSHCSYSKLMQYSERFISKGGDEADMPSLKEREPAEVKFRNTKI